MRDDRESGAQSCGTDHGSDDHDGGLSPAPISLVHQVRHCTPVSVSRGGPPWPQRRPRSNNGTGALEDRDSCLVEPLVRDPEGQLIVGSGPKSGEG